jgi:NAD-dependent protein deacetylase/lipoamidase
MPDKDTNILIYQLAELIINSSKIVVFTGAGISTESGIPDFRSPGGLWDRFDPDDFTYDKFMNDRGARIRQWQLLKEGYLTEAVPNPAHYGIAEMNDMDRLDCVITQNIDSLHQKAGVPDEKVYELHGNSNWIRCTRCKKRYPYQQIRSRITAGEEMPDCDDCHGILKPEIIFFGEALPGETLEQATMHASACDLCLVIGSTLVVYPAAYMPAYAVRNGAKLAIINLSETPMDTQADVLINGKAGEIMSAVMDKIREL